MKDAAPVPAGTAGPAGPRAPSPPPVSASHRPYEAPEERVQQHQLPRFAHATRQREVNVIGGRGEQQGSHPTELHRRLTYLRGGGHGRSAAPPQIHGAHGR